MQHIGFIAAVFASGLTCQIIWWRIRGPSLTSIIYLFASLFMISSVASLHGNFISFGIAEYVCLTLLYSSAVLSYTIICSAIQARSPSLSIITYIATYGVKTGCPEEELHQHVVALDAITDRLKQLEAGGLLEIVGSNCRLTRKARLIARLFEFASKVFDLPKGG